MVKTLIALRHMSVKEFGVGFRDMKKAIAIIILSLLWCNVGGLPVISVMVLKKVI